MTENSPTSERGLDLFGAAAHALAVDYHFPLHKLTLRQCGLLAVLADAYAGVASPTDLASWGSVSQAATSRAMNGLASLRLVERADHPADKRACLWRITERGSSVRRRYGDIR